MPPAVRGSLTVAIEAQSLVSVTIVSFFKKYIYIFFFGSAVALRWCVVSGMCVVCDV